MEKVELLSTLLECHTPVISIWIKNLSAIAMKRTPPVIPHQIRLNEVFTQYQKVSVHWS